MMPLQAATQWDALAHVYYDEKLYNGFSSASTTSFGANRNGIDKVAAIGQFRRRGVLLDVARYFRVDYLKGGTVIQPDDLDAVVAAQEIELDVGDVLLIRTGWWLQFLESWIHRVGARRLPVLGGSALNGYTIGRSQPLPVTILPLSRAPVSFQELPFPSIC